MLKNISGMINLYIFLNAGKLIYRIKAAQWKYRMHRILSSKENESKKNILPRCDALLQDANKRQCIQLKQALAWFQSHDSAKYK